MAQASIFFAVGLQLDGWMAKLVQATGGGRAQVFDVGPLVDPRLVPETILALADEAQGAPGAPGSPGAPGEPGKPADRTTVIVTPPPPPRN